MKKFFIKIFFIITIIVAIFILSLPEIINIKNQTNVKNIKIIGSNKINKDNLHKITDIYINKNINFINSWKIRENIMLNLKLINDIEVLKKYPDEIIIKIYEKIPIMLLSKDKEYFVIDKKNSLEKIDKLFFEENNYLKEILYVEANNTNYDLLMQNMGIFIDLIDSEFFKRINGLYYINGRRIDMMIDRKIKVMIPEEISKEFIEKIFNTIDSLKLKGEISNNSLYTTLDMRIKDKIFIKNIES
jgi:hypothetical protein